MSATLTADPHQDPLVVQDVVKTFRSPASTKRSPASDAVTALAGVSLSVRRGTFLAIMGASGSGKSTLLHLMAGLAQADSGQVRVAGTDLTSLGDHALTLFRRRHIGLVFQAFNLIPTLTAEENVLLPLMLDNKDDAPARSRTRELMTRLGLGSRLTHRPDALSGGEQQRVAIARALVTNPDVILADEPTGNLDTANSKSVCELLRDLSAQGRTIVMVTHEPSVAAYAKEVAILRDGKLLARFDTPENLDATALAARYQAAISV
jgi:putative ABC transport system ATP-binding protein